MRFIADLHIHSHFSLATSRNLRPEYLEYWAQLKGIDVVGTGDCTHPGWLAELREKLEPAGNGLYRLKKEFRLPETQAFLPEKTRRNVHFILTGEISSIYRRNGKTRKVHSVCVLPDFAAAVRLQERLGKLGNIASDGRPILGIDARDILAMVLETGERSFVIPAHIWTPWFSVLGDKSGFDSVEECYGDLTKHIFAVETGLSSDPPMNRACGFLDAFRLVSNSDAHSPEKLGREANLFDADPGYAGIFEALRTGDGFLGTVEFFPQEGKYHYDGHRKCGVCWDPLETLRHAGVCPACGKPVTRGVMYRVAELADRAPALEANKEFYSITSLPDLAAEIAGCMPGTKKARKVYFDILERVGPDLHTLLFADLSDIRERGGELLAEGIRRLRAAEVHVEEGYDGEFGRITVFRKGEAAELGSSSLFASADVPAAGAGARKDRCSIRFDIAAFQRLRGKAGAAAASPETASSRAPEDVQSLAIGHDEGVCMVLAGPGTGKTFVLVERVVRLIRGEKAAPGEVLAVTFSNRAAEEMRARVTAKLPGAEVPVMTFHAFGLSLLREHCRLFGRDERFLIVEREERDRLLAEALGKTGFRKRMRLLDAAKQGAACDGETAELVRECDRVLAGRNVFDLDDLIFLAAALLRDHPEAREACRQRHRWLLVDEYQDVNPAQYELLRLAAGDGNPNLFVIGDPDQAIYGFRGSDSRLIERLKGDYPRTRTVRLGRSFRCPSSVLRVAGQALGRGDALEGVPLDLRIDVTECETDRSEADLIAGRIERMIGGTRSFSRDSGAADGETAEGIAGFSDFAVLCRAGVMFPVIAEALAARGIPCQVVGSEPFVREEPFASLLDRYRSAVLDPSGDGDVPAAVRAGEAVVSVLERLAAGGGAPEESRRRFAALGKGFGSDHYGFLRGLALRSGQDDLDPPLEAVRLMTLHASKGLEFNAVFIPGCEQGIIPFELFGARTPGELAEEERLFYVGATRTRRHLALTRAKKRMFKGRLLQLPASALLARLEQGLLNRGARGLKPRDPQLQLPLFEQRRTSVDGENNC